MNPHNLRLRTPEAAEYLGLSSSTLEKRRLTGDGPVFCKCGRTVVYDIQDLDKYLADCRRRSTSDPGSGAVRS
jgi:hypothetical protein